MQPAEVPGFVRVDHLWTADERRSAVLCRLGRFGVHSRVVPGLYALGRPGSTSAVLVTASYRLSFDLLRRSLRGVDCWILVLDTKGLGVGSASAAGLFGTDELVTRISASRLSRVVTHRRLILPPRASSDVDAGPVARATGFEVRFGPRRAADIARFISDDHPGGPPGPETFPGVPETLVLTPVEIGRSLMLFPGFAFVVLLYAGLGPRGVSLDAALAGSWRLLLLGLASVICGSLLAPVLAALIPRLPLWAAGAAAGLAASAALLYGVPLATGVGAFLPAASWLFFPAASAWLAARFADALPVPGLGPSGRKTPLLAAAAALIAVLVIAALVAAKAAQWHAGK